MPMMTAGDVLMAAGRLRFNPDGSMLAGSMF